MVTWGSAIRSRGRRPCPLTPLNWNPHSLLQISPTPTLVPSTQLPLVYSSYMYPPRSEERDSEKDGFKLDLFNKEAGINRVTGELLLPDWLGTKSCLYLIQFPGHKHALDINRLPDIDQQTWTLPQRKVDQIQKFIHTLSNFSKHQQHKGVSY